LADLLTRVVAAFEAFSPKVYLDAGEKPTVGYGHLLLPGEDYSDGLSEEQALVLLESDLRAARAAVDRLFHGVYLADYEWDALTSFVFNLGSGQAVRESSLRQHVIHGNTISAAAEFIKWVNATMPDGSKKKLAGLVRRRDCESVWFLGAHPSIVERMSGALPEKV